MILDYWEYLIVVKAIPWLLGITIFIILPILIAQFISKQGTDQ